MAEASFEVAAGSTSDAGTEALLLTGGDGSFRFALHDPPSTPTCRGLVVFVPPFGEEMNKSRRLVAGQARALAERGFAVLRIDLAGCGDSSGDFGEANWTRWVDDIVAAARWLRSRHEPVDAGTRPAPLWLWGLRVGCLLATRAAERLSPLGGLVLWQPQLRGDQALAQFLRLATASNMLSGQTGASAGQLRAALDKGRPVEVAGYRIHPALAQGLAGAALLPPAGACTVIWLEVTAAGGGTLAPASQRTVDQWRAAGLDVTTEVVAGPAFWQTVEIEDAPELVQATNRAIERRCAAEGTPAGLAGPPEARPAGTRSSAGCEHPAWLKVESLEMLAVITRPPADRAPDEDPQRGVVIVVGGPQYRVGSHRQFVRLARSLAEAGIATLRFDVRGMGDSPGPLPQFAALSADIRAAIDGLVRSSPAVKRVALVGLCDGASAALLYLRECNDRRVDGAVLINPWVRHAETLASTQVRHYYARRLVQPELWRKVLSGGIGRHAILDFGRSITTAVRARLGAARARPAREEDFREGMLEGLERFGGRVLVALSANDFVAREFDELTRSHPGWRKALGRSGVRQVVIEGADHTFSRPEDGNRLEREVRSFLSAPAHAMA